MLKQALKILILIGLLSGCASSARDRPRSELEQWMQAEEKVKVLSTTAMIDDIVGQIGGERIVHIPLISGEIDPHSYELVKGDDEKLHRAQVIFYNGLGLEHGASLRYQLQTNPQAVALGDAVLVAHPDEIIHIDQQLDPHIWMDIALWSEIINPIVKALEKTDPEGQEIYRANALALRQQMLKEHEEIYSALQQIPAEKRYLVTSHDAFNYFTRAYLAAPDEKKQTQWQIRFEAPEGLAPDGQLGATDIQEIITHLVQFQIRVIFPESNVSRDSLKKIVDACRQKGFTVQISREMLYGDAMGGPESGAETYLKMIRHDADVLISTWSDHVP